MSLISLFDDPIFAPVSSRSLARRQAAYRQLAQQQAQLLNAFSDIFDGLTSDFSVRTPKTELREVANGYLLEAELPGVKKEDLDVTIGEGGKTIRIEGKAYKRFQPEGAGQQSQGTQQPAAGQTAAAESSSTEKPAEKAPESTSTEVAQKSAGEVAKAEEQTFSTTFSQSFTLPRPVDGSRVVARLEDGVLTLVVPFLEDSQSVKINVE